MWICVWHIKFIKQYVAWAKEFSDSLCWPCFFLSFLPIVLKKKLYNILGIISSDKKDLSETAWILLFLLLGEVTAWELQVTVQDRSDFFFLLGNRTSVKVLPNELYQPQVIKLKVFWLLGLLAYGTNGTETLKIPYTTGSTWALEDSPKMHLRLFQILPHICKQ